MADDSMRSHWTNDDPDAFLYRIGSDFVSQLRHYMKAEGVSSDELARRLDVTKGRVSQVMNDPVNLTTRTALQFALALGKKVSLVAYDDGDPANERGPVNSAIFEAIWLKFGPKKKAIKKRG